MWPRLRLRSYAGGASWAYQTNSPGLMSWPSHVKLTSAFSAIRDHSLYRTRGRPDLQTEKPILPQRQYEDPNRRHGPQIRKRQVARLAVKAEQADTQDAESQHSSPLDRTHRHQKDQG